MTYKKIEQEKIYCEKIIYETHLVITLKENDNPPTKPNRLTRGNKTLFQPLSPEESPISIDRYFSLHLRKIDISHHLLPYEITMQQF